MDVSINARSGWRVFLAPSLLGALIYFVCLWRLDFPKPSMDDLFQAGAGLNLASGGDFSNPLIARQEFPSHYFFVYPPLHSFVFAGWLKLFGISAASATAYAMCNYIIICAATIVLLRRHGAPAALEWFVPLGVTFGIVYLGLRPEPLAVALAMTGLALIDADATCKSAAHQFTGFLLLFLGGSAAPRVTLFVAALSFYAGYRAWRAATSPRERRRVVTWWLGALLLAGLTLLVLIDFRLKEFLTTFHYHAAGRLYKDKLGAISMFLFSYMGYLQLPLIFLPLILLVWVLRKPKDDFSLPAVFLAGAIPLVLWTGGIGSASGWWAFLMLVLLAASLAKSLSRSRSVALQVLIFLILMVVNRKTFAQCWGIASGGIKADRGSELAEVLKLQPTPEHPLLVDGWVARYVYDYRLPPGMLDVEWSTRFPGGAPGSYRVSSAARPQLRKGDIFLVGSYMVDSLTKYTLLEYPKAPVWQPLGIRGLKFDEYPCRVYIIPAESCKDVREGAATTLPTGQ